MKTDKAFSKELYVTGVTAGGNDGAKNPGLNGGLVKINVTVTEPEVVPNIAPKFKSEHPKSIEFDFSKNPALVSVDTKDP